MEERKERKETMQEAYKKAKMQEKEKCNKRLALIQSKYPNIQEAPKSIQVEYWSLSNITAQIDAGVGDNSNGKYVVALGKIESVREENKHYISPEEEAKFEFPEIDFKAIEDAIDNMHSFEDRSRVLKQLSNLGRFHSNEQNERINALIEKWDNTPIIPIKNEKQVESTAPVKLSKFGQIYQKAKGKLRGFVDKLKDRFNKDRNAEEKDNNTEGR